MNRKVIVTQPEGTLSGICSDCKDGSGFEWNHDNPRELIALSVCCGAIAVPETLQEHFADGRPYVHIG